MNDVNFQRTLQRQAFQHAQKAVKSFSSSRGSTQNPAGGAWDAPQTLSRLERGYPLPILHPPRRLGHLLSAVRRLDQDPQADRLAMGSYVTSRDAFPCNKVLLRSVSYIRGWNTQKRFWGGNGHLKLNAQNIKTCMLSKLLHQIQPNFVQWQRPPNTLRGWSKGAYNKSKMVISRQRLWTVSAVKISSL